MIRNFRLCASINGPFVYEGYNSPSVSDGNKLNFVGVREECHTSEADKDITGTLVRMKDLPYNPINISSLYNERFQKLN